MSKSIREVLEELRAFSLDERDKGARFEQLMKNFLQNDTQYERLFDQVWLWSEYPDRGNRVDTGIDLVARERDTGELIAIQCKFYAPQTPISKPAIDSFLASSSRAEFKGRMFISTSDNWGKNAEEAISGQKPEVARIGLSDLDESSIDWDQYSFQKPEKLERKARKSPRPHQEEAIESVLRGFDSADRGKLIMACGTGKTYTSLKLVERMFPNGGTVLFLVPSISLLSQALKEWTIESESSLRSYAVCSDVSVGKRKNDEDLPITDLAFPATTNTERLVEKFTEAGPNKGGLTVIFSTYQSIDVVAQAQSRGIPEFDLIVCDEAHRTTGVTLSGDDESAFVKVHNQDFIKGKKRLYMTATPKVFSDASNKKAEEAGAVLADMGKPDLFGEEFHRLGFGEAVERGILTDYKVLVLAVDEAYVARRFQRQFADDDNELNLEDAAKIVGCWNGLSKRSTEQEEFQIDPGSMKRAVAFARSIAESKKIASMFQAVVDEETAQLDDSEAEYLRCEVEHVDGSFNSLSRNEKLDWLRKEAPENTARILSNARCLTEGVDVPALDAVMFLNPRDSQVDVVQAVGRVMRKLEGKKYGYVILPIGVPADMDPATALNDNKKYKVVWQVLQALRSHDERFDAMVNKIDLTKKAPQIGIIGVGGDSEGKGTSDHGALTLEFPNFDQWRDAILAKIVQKVGEKRYWENWAKDIAGIATRNITRIRELVNGSDSSLAKKFERFVKGLQDNLNPSITADDAIEMLAQHLITKPVFDALFEGYDFSQRNPVSLVMQDMLDALEQQNLEKEADTLGKFYDSVRARAAGIDSAEAKQTIVKQLYEEFFRNAFQGTSERLGIAYTPNEMVDFIIHSVEAILQDKFKTSLAKKGVHVIDPFTGTGTFIVRLLQSGLISKDSLVSKYQTELHANELLLLAYYVAAINIEETFHEISGKDYTPFEGIVLTDTFQLYEKDDSLDGLGVFPDNNERAEKQRSLDIKVVIGNPPYSKGQESANDDNQNLKYPSLDERISETYAKLSTAQNKNSLYDSYIRSIRWASDRIGDSGIVAFVSNGGFIDGNTADGLRKSLLDEFDDVYVLNMRGNTRTSGELARREGGQTFGSASRATIAIYFLVRTSSGPYAGRLHYRDIGDYLSREEKLQILADAKDLSGLEWTQLEPNGAGDWINQRSSEFTNFIPLAPKDASEGGLPAVFELMSSGLKTNRDWWVNNFATSELEANVRRMFDFFNSQVAEYQASPDPESWKRNNDPKQFSWNRADDNRLKQGRELHFDKGRIYESLYRPFVRQETYFSRDANDMVYRLYELFPTNRVRNPSILVLSPSSRTPFSVLATDMLPNLGMFVDPVQVFSRYRYEPTSSVADQLDFGDNQEVEEGGFRRIDNISDSILEAFRDAYGTEVSKDDIFFFIYGLLHSREYRSRFGADLTRSLPRLPWVSDFEKFASSGKKLWELHAHFEQVPPLAAKVVGDLTNAGQFKKMRIVEKEEDSFSVEITPSLRLEGLPARALDYTLGSKSALDWVIEKYQITVDSDSQLTSNPLLADMPPGSGGVKGIADLVTQVCAISLKTMALIDGLPALELRKRQAG